MASHLSLNLISDSLSRRASQSTSGRISSGLNGKPFCRDNFVKVGNLNTSRDFVYVKDVVDVNLHFAGKHNVKGIFNLGTGIPRSFNDVANTLITLMNKGSINYIPFPFDLKNKYQNYTKADTIKLASTGVSTNFTSLEEGISEYFTLLENTDVNDH